MSPHPTDRSGHSRHAGHGIVVGVGHRDRGDDAVGPVVCDRIRDRAAHRWPAIDVWVVEADPSTLAVTWRPSDRVVVVDAVVTGAAPGTVHRLHPDMLTASACNPERALSTHGLGVADAIRLSEVLGTRPRQLWVVAVEAASFDLGASLSPAVERAVPGAVDEVVSLLRSD